MTDIVAENKSRDAIAVTWKTLFYYALPPIGAGYMFCIVSLYAMKFSTDVLLIAPAVMGLIFGISRFWDAISDPLVGYLSDKTRSRYGRRRPWLFWSIIPVFVSFWMISAPPEWMTGNTLVLWMGAGVILFYSAQTMFIVPHMSLGAELSDDYHERNKIFGARHAGWIIGYISALLTMYWLIKAEQEGAAQVRQLASDQSFYAGIFSAILILVCVFGLRERAGFEGRGAEKPWAAARDIWKNSHARLLLVVIFIENLGGAVITILTLYNAQYVLNAPTMAPVFILAYMVWSLLLVPLWMPLARRVGKKNLWISSMVVTAFAFGCMFFLREGDDLILIGLASIAGAAGGCGGTINPSIKSDVIDYDEYRTGERKEGAYFAAWYFVSKSAYGMMLTITGFALSIVGFVPNVAQNETVILAMRFLYGGVPFIFYLLGAYLLMRFAFNEDEHKDIVAELAKRAN
jgi:GPH family glycoside/pentoside/hexuronide:cation symporter